MGGSFAGHRRLRFGHFYPAEFGGLADVLDIIENQGVAKIEEIKRLFLVALSGDDFNLPLPTER